MGEARGFRWSGSTAEARQAAKDNSLLIMHLWMPKGAGNAFLTLLWLCGSSVDVTSQEQQLRHLQMGAQVCCLEIKAKGVKVVFKCNVLYLGQEGR